jgi:hypothetical protein
MGAIDFELMSLDELWSLHESLAEMLAKRLSRKKQLLKPDSRSSIKRKARRKPSAAPRRDALTLSCFRNIEIPMIPPRPGRAGASSRAGWSLCCEQANLLTISGSLRSEAPIECCGGFYSQINQQLSLKPVSKVALGEQPSWVLTDQLQS